MQYKNKDICMVYLLTNAMIHFSRLHILFGTWPENPYGALPKIDFGPSPKFDLGPVYSWTLNLRLQIQSLTDLK